MKQRSFHAKLLGAIFLPSFLILVISATAGGIAIRRQAIERTRSEAVLIANSLATELRVISEEAASAAKAVSRDSILSKVLRGESVDRLEEIEMIAVFDREGRTVFSKRSDPSRTAFTRDPLRSSLLEKGRMSGVFKTVDLGALADILVPADAKPDLVFLVAGARIPGRDRSAGEVVVGKDVTALIAKLGATGSGTIDFSTSPEGADDILFPLVVAPPDVDMVGTSLVYRVQSTTVTTEAFRRMISILGPIFLTLLVLTLVLAAFMSRQLMIPVGELKKGVTAFMESRFNYRVSVDTDDEFGELAKAFNTMMEGFRLSRMDGLTSLFNRRHFEQMLPRLIEIQKRLPKPALSLSFVDIDFFKKINDSLGHHGGDQALRHLAAILDQTLPVTDIIARYGGEEFVIIHADADLEAAAKTCQELIDKVRETPLQTPQGPRTFTISAGLASVEQAGFDGAVLVELADRALYEAKRSGRDRLVVNRDPRT